MKFGIIGAGAMGCLLGAFLKEKTKDIWLVDTWEDHVSRINENGLTITDKGQTRNVSIRATMETEKVGICDVVVISTKFHDTRQAVQSGLCMMNSDTVVITIQNGIGNVEIISEFVGCNQIVSGLTTLGSVLRGPGMIEATFSENAETYLWPLQGEPNERVKAIVEVFSQSGLSFSLTPDVRERIWKKLCLNAAFSILVAIPRLKCGDFIDQPSSRELIRGLVSEIAAVAKREGIDMDPESAYQYVVDLAKQAPNHLTSALIDVINRRKTEVDCLNGAIVAKGRQYGIETPFNTAVFNLIQIIENTYDKAIQTL